MENLKNNTELYEKLNNIKIKLNELKKYRDDLQSKCNHDLILFFGVVRGMDRREDMNLYRCPFCNKDLDQITNIIPEKIVDVSNLKYFVLFLNEPVLTAYYVAQSNIERKIEKDIFPLIINYCEMHNYNLTYNDIKTLLENAYGNQNDARVNKKN